MDNINSVILIPHKSFTDSCFSALRIGTAICKVELRYNVDGTMFRNIVTMYLVTTVSTCR